MNAPVVLVPEFRAGGGTGHLLRLLELAAGLRPADGGEPADVPQLAAGLRPADGAEPADGPEPAVGPAGEVTMLFRSGVDISEARDAVARCAELCGLHTPSRPPRVLSSASAAGAEAVRAAGLVVLDCRELSFSEFRSLGCAESAGVIVGLDLGGTARPYCDYLIDTLPRVDRVCAPNVSDRGLLRYPSCSRARAPERFERVLLSFGGEDRARLTERCAEACRTLGVPSVWATRGPLFGRELPADLQRFDPSGLLRDELSRFDLVLTSFGLTAFEAAGAGCAVLLVNPSRYHQRLGRRAGFRQLGVRPSLPRLLGGLRSAFREVSSVLQATRTALPEAPHELHAVLQTLDRGQAVACPVCGTRAAPSVARTPGRSYHRCPECGMLYLRRLRESGVSYDERYFFEAYRRQYGRSYLEDFDAIKTMGRRRLEQLDAALAEFSRALPGEARPALLDIGAAYGPFLAAAREAGYEPYGVDVSEAAVRYLRDTLGVPAVSCRIEELNPDAAFARTRFDVVTMWYVIEHLPALDEVLRKVASMLPVGGVFAFSSPNGEGVSARRNRARFLSDGPPDHLTIWEPSRAAAVLSRYGFRVSGISITGHHPERFPGMPSDAKSGFRYRVWHLVSRAAKLGDTFELYAVKVRDTALPQRSAEQPEAYKGSRYV